MMGRSFILVTSILSAAVSAGCLNPPPPQPPVKSKSAVEVTSLKTPQPIFKSALLLESAAFEKKVSDWPAGGDGEDSARIGNFSLKPSALKTEAALFSPAPADSLENAAPHARTHVEAGPARELFTPLDALFSQYLGQLKDFLKRSEEGEKFNDFESLQKADLEKRLIALFFLRERRDLKEYRELLDSFTRFPSPVLSLEILQAALFQELGMPRLRDQVLNRLPVTSPVGARGPEGGFALRNLTLAKQIAGYRNLGKLEQPRLSPGEEVFVYGEFEGFQNVSLPPRPDAARQPSPPSYRRSFSASTALFNGLGELIDCKPLLLAGQATEIADRPEKPVYFWGRFQVPPEAARGSYRLEVLAVDLENHAASTASVAFTVGGAGSP